MPGTSIPGSSRIQIPRRADDPSTSSQVLRHVHFAHLFSTPVQPLSVFATRIRPIL